MNTDKNDEDLIHKLERRIKELTCANKALIDYFFKMESIVATDQFYFMNDLKKLS